MPTTRTTPLVVKRPGTAKAKPSKSKTVNVDPVSVASVGTDQERDITIFVRLSSEEMDIIFEAGLGGIRIAKNMREITLAEANRIIAQKNDK